ELGLFPAGAKIASGSSVAAAKWHVQKTTYRLAATHKCLAKRNKSRTGAKATKSRSRSGSFCMNNLESVRKYIRIKRTPNDAGTKLTIEFTYYDNGFVSINGSPKGDYTSDEAERWLASTRFVMQMIEEFRNYINKSKLALAHKAQDEDSALSGEADGSS